VTKTSSKASVGLTTSSASGQITGAAVRVRVGGVLAGVLGVGVGFAML
jgi:hypothetical protein